MNNQTLYGVYNCSATMLGLNISFLFKFNSTELLMVLEDTLDRSNVHDKEFLDCVSNHQERPFDLLWWQKLAWSLVFAVMLLVATGGNIIVMWIVLAHRRMRTVTNYFLVNLSVADLMMSLLNCAFNFTFLLNANWPFGVVYCTINNFVAHLTVASSVFTLVVISFDRYSNGRTRIVCCLLWPDGDYLRSKIGYTYDIVFLSLTYLIPISLMAICYALMGRKLWITESIGELTQYQKNSIKSKRKVVKMFITVVAIFAICWLPYQGFFIFIYHHRQLTQSSYVQHIYLGFYWLAMSNAMVNPIIYYWMNIRFRIYFQLIICKCCCPMIPRNLEDRHTQQLVECQRSEVIPCNSRRFKLSSIRWKNSMGDSHAQNFRTRSVVEKNRSSQDATTV
ncbi:tachykinin-like peptides receptor 86C isoform X2 [Augochlora pura]